MAMQTTQSGHTNPPRLEPWARVNCTEKGHGCVHYFQCGRIGHIASSGPGKQTREQEVSTALLPRQDGNKEQPIIQVHTGQMLCSALLDSGCSHTIVNARLCCTWSKRRFKIISINGETQACCWAGVWHLYQRWLVDPIPQPKAWTTQRSDAFNGSYTTKQVKGATCHRLPWTQPIHSQYQCMCKQVIGVAPKRIKHVIAGSEEGWSAGAGWQNFMAVSDSDVSWQKVLSEQTGF